MKHEIIAEGIETTIYALYDEGELPRYIGRTKMGLAKRMIFHRSHANEGRLPVHRWLLKHNKKVRAEVIEIVKGLGASEESHWIKRFKQLGANLLNLTGGGEMGNLMPFSESHRKKISDALKKGSFFSCETCQKEFWRKPCEINKGDCRFCSKVCYQTSQRGVSKPVPALCMERGIAAAAAKRRAQTHCKRGHPLSGENLYTHPKGVRVCIECRKLHKRSFRERAR